MDIYVRVKAIGKRKDILAPTPYTIPDGICSLRQLLTAVVQEEVAQYNSKEAEAQLIPFLTQQELDNQAKIGKVSFGTILQNQGPHDSQSDFSLSIKQEESHSFAQRTLLASGSSLSLPQLLT